MDDKIKAINQLLFDYFSQNPSSQPIPAKDFMKDFVIAGIFSKDHRYGLPIRAILRSLDRNNKLDRIPYVYAVRKNKNTNWYFVPLTAAE